MENYLELIEKYNQKHLLNYIENANEEQRKNLIKEIEKIDFEEMNNLYDISNRDREKAIESYIIEHVKFTDKYKMSNEKFNELNKIGENIIKNNEYAVVTMAGGQGTRLGHNGPKGSFMLNVNPKPK